MNGTEKSLTVGGDSTVHFDFRTRDHRSHVVRASKRPVDAAWVLLSYYCIA